MPVAPATGLARAQVLLAAVCFGTTGTAQALLRPEGVGPLSVGAARIVLGGAALVALAALAARRARSRGAAAPGDRPLAGRARTMLVAVSGVGVAVYQLAFFAAADLTGVAVGAVVAIGSGPAFAGALDRLVNGTRLTGRWAAATALAAAGVALLGLDAGAGPGVDPRGVALALASGAGYATYTVLARRLIEAGDTPDATMARTFGAGAVLLVPVLLLTGPGWVLTTAGLGLVVWLGVVTTTLAYALFGRGLRVLGAGEAATLTLAEPLTATLLGLLVLGERPGPVGVAGALLVLAGLVTLARPGASVTADPAAIPPSPTDAAPTTAAPTPGARTTVAPPLGAPPPTAVSTAAHSVDGCPGSPHPATSGETDLATLLRDMRPHRNPGSFAFVRVDGPVPVGAEPVVTVREEEGLTLVLPQQQAAALGLAHDVVLAWITLRVHSSLEAVGLTAAFSAALGGAGISANVVAGALHDHVFVPEVDADRALAVLEALAAGRP